MLHCAEDIGDAIEVGENAQESIDVAIIREALETINLCVKHQKNIGKSELETERLECLLTGTAHIVDDVLSFSKLDASLLSLKPTVCEPSKALKTTLGIVSCGRFS